MYTQVKKIYHSEPDKLRVAEMNDGALTHWILWPTCCLIPCFDLSTLAESFPVAVHILNPKHLRLDYSISPRTSLTRSSNKYECTISLYQEWKTLLHGVLGRRCVRTHHAAALLCVKWRSSWNCDVISQIRCRQLKNNPTKFHPKSIWNDGAVCFLKRSPQQKK